MNIADDNVIRIERTSDTERLSSRVSAGMVYAAQRIGRAEEEHDGRGLIVAIVLCVICWAVLGYFLLT